MQFGSGKVALLLQGRSHEEDSVGPQWNRTGHRAGSVQDRDRLVGTACLCERGAECILRQRIGGVDPGGMGPERDGITPHRNLEHRQHFQSDDQGHDSGDEADDDRRSSDAGERASDRAADNERPW